MKKLKLILLLNVFLLEVDDIKAQDEDCAVCGWYADGVKVEKIDCYAWDKLQLVLPYNAGMEGYDFVNVTVNLEEGNHLLEGVKSVPGSALKTLLKGNYIVYTVFSKEYGDGTLMKGGFGSTSPLGERECTITRDILPKTGKAGIKGQNLTCWVRGATITGYNEKYNPGRRMVERKPVYSKTDLSKLYSVLFVNSANSDFAQPCAFPGKKVDMNNLDGSGSKSNEVVEQKNSESANVKSSAPSGASDVASLPKLDTKKPGYFENRNGDGIADQGYKVKGKLEGEYRSFSSGKLEYVYHYKNGSVEGSVTEYWETGKVKTQGQYKNDKKDGEWKKFTEAGKPAGSDVYVDGEKQ